MILKNNIETLRIVDAAILEIEKISRPGEINISEKLELSSQEKSGLILSIAHRFAPLINKQRMLYGKNGISPISVAERIVDIVSRNGSG